MWRTSGRSLHFNGPIIYLVAALKWAEHFDCMSWIYPACYFLLHADFELVEFSLACLTMLNLLLLCVSKSFRMTRSYFLQLYLKLVPKRT